MTRPTSRPSVEVATRTTRMMATGGHPARASDAAIMVESATTEPTERSMPPVRMTNVMPTASTMRKALSTNRFAMTCPEAKPRYWLAPAAKTSTSSTRVTSTGV
jgi:hypothetical protein